jgi:hypothetical protein
MNDKSRMTTVWNNLLSSAKTKKRCMGCDRGIHENELKGIETYVSLSIPAAVEI